METNRGSRPAHPGRTALVGSIALTVLAGCDGGTPIAPAGGGRGTPAAGGSASGRGAPPEPTASGPSARAPDGPASPDACPPGDRFPPPSATGVSELAGTSPDATLWALFFPTEGGRMRAGAELKVVWRMTGTGDLTMTASGPGGATVRPVWGPEPHDGSSWHRPGDEWGTGWSFPTPGCWTVRAVRTGGATGIRTLRIGPA
ncbi:hypothetical protein AB0J86_20025 [Micromonospora sp. NPDC049559]|uniref:hypothetical protein n=1 Tax=Micromonospora sp. NPDC049559 TaxID=3155923 RepID=UPI003414B27C